MQSRIVAIILNALLTATPALAVDYTVSDQASCEALPAVTWTGPNECELVADFVLTATDSLTIRSGVRLVLPSGRTLTNTGGTFKIGVPGSFASLAQKGNIDNFPGGLIEGNGFWDARDGAVINNFVGGTIKITNQLQVPVGTLNNFGFVHNASGGNLSIGNSSELINHFGSTLLNEHNIRVNGLLENNALLTNNDDILLESGRLENNASLLNNGLIELESPFDASLLKNAATLTNNGIIFLDCPSVYQNTGTFIGNPVDIPYCINGGDWSDPGAWNKNAVPPPDGRIVVESGTNHLDVDFALSGSILINAVLQIDSGFQLEILAAGKVTNTNEFITNALIINNHSLINRGELVNEGRIINNADFGNEGLISTNGVIENHGLFQTTSTFMQNGIDNRPGGIMDNSGFWRVNRSLNHNKGEIRNRSGAEFELNNTLINESGGFIENIGLLTVNDSLNFPGSLENETGGLIINNLGASLNITSADASLENAGETRNEGAIGNDGIINNPGRICGAGSIAPNAVNGNAPELICNRAPRAVAIPDAGLFECTGPTTNVSLDGRLSSDPDLRDELTYNWSPATGLLDASSALTSGNFGLGSKNYSLTVMDLLGESDSDEASFTVRDTTAPAMSCPADITLVADDMCIGTGDPTLAQAVDICDTNPSVTRTPAGNSWMLGETEVTHTGTDGSGNAAACASVVEVVDETMPAIQCNTVGVFVRPGMPVSFQATANDNCSVASVSVTAFDCWKINPSGRRVDKTGKCVVSLSGDTINILEPSGVGTIIGWTVEAVDGSGNAATASCEVISTRANRN